MKIIFLGTPDAASGVLSAMIEAGITPAAAVTSLDKPSGRGLELKESAVGQTARKNGIPVFKPESVREESFLRSIRDISPDLAVVVAFGKILPRQFLEIPKLGCINLHASLLPKYRGASPIQAALLNGDKETGITIFRLNEKMDEGDIIAAEKEVVREDDNAESLSKRLFAAGSALLINVLREFEGGRIKLTPQDASKATYCGIIRKSDGNIVFARPAAEILNMIRAYTPWPGAFCSFNGKRIKILKAEAGGTGAVTSSGEQGEVLQIIKDKGFVLSAGQGQFVVLEVQPENSKRMSADEFVRGYRVAVGDKFYSAEALKR